jgi:phosphatidyl-myo-inositol dimannoside synthase
MQRITENSSSLRKSTRRNRDETRVLFMTDAFLPHAGGARVYYYNLFREWTRNAANRVTILTKKVPGWKAFDQEQRSEQFRIVRSGRPLPSWKYWQWPKIALPFANAASLLLQNDFDMIHSGDLYPQGVLSLWFKRLSGKPYVAYCHGEEITQIDGRRFQPKVRDAIFRNADLVVAASEFARQNLLRIGINPERIRKITPGVDCNRFQPTNRRRDLVERHGLAGKTVLLTVARLVPRKGHRLVLDALRRLVLDSPDLVYLIVGTGPEEEQLRRLVAEWNLNHVVRFVGFVPDEDLPSYYNLADLYVMPNSEEKGDIEGFGMVFLEANACGKPVIGGRSGGAAEAVLHGRTGVLVDPQDAGELAAAVRMFTANPSKMQELGAVGLSRARREFSWASRGLALEEVNREVLAGAPQTMIERAPNEQIRTFLTK